MISSVNIDNSKDKTNNRLKKNISNFSENIEPKNSFKLNKNENENKSQKTKYINKKDIIIDNKNNNKIILKKNNNKITKDKISPNKKQNNNINKVNTNIYGHLTNYKDKPNQLIKNKEILVSSQINNDKKYKGNNEDKNEVCNKKNINININDKDITATPNNKNINLINIGNSASSYSKRISGSSSAINIAIKDPVAQFNISSDDDGKLLN